MDEFLRSASHQIVTGVLLLVWSGLLLGIAWKVFSLALNFIQRMFIHQPVPIFLRKLPVQRARLPSSTSPRLETQPPERFLAETPLPLLPDPHNEITFQLFHHKEETAL
jgi:hypothetical protein